MVMVDTADEQWNHGIVDVMIGQAA
jgi:hypothetical protein